jgi:hypothetical protein
MNYMISLKYTFPDSYAYTFWRPDGNGYAWYLEWAGLYKDGTRRDVIERKDGILVPKALVDRYKVQALHEKKIVTLIPVNQATMRRFGIRKGDLQGGMSNVTERDIILWNEIKPITPLR